MTSWRRLLALAGVVVLASWALLQSVLAIPSYLLPSPMAVFAQLYTFPELYLRSTLATMITMSAGGVLASVAGVVIGLSMAERALWRRAIMPYLVTLRVVPLIAVAPLFVIVFGLEWTAAVAFVALIAVFPMALSTYSGLSRRDPRLEALLDSVDAPRRTHLAIALPKALPDIVSGLKQLLPAAFVGTIIAEWFLGQPGLGAILLQGAESVAMAVVMAALFALIAVGLVSFTLLSLACNRLLERYHLGESPTQAGVASGEII